MIFLQICFYMSPQIRKFAIDFNKALDFIFIIQIF